MRQPPNEIAIESYHNSRKYFNRAIQIIRYCEYVDAEKYELKKTRDKKEKNIYSSLPYSVVYRFAHDFACE